MMIISASLTTAPPEAQQCGQQHGKCRYTKLKRLRLTCISANYVNSCLQHNSYDAGSRKQGKMFVDSTKLNVANDQTQS